MNKATKVKVTRCYLVQILDKDENELDCDYCFLDRAEAKKLGEEMKKNYNKDHLDYYMTKGIDYAQEEIHTSYKTD